MSALSSSTYLHSGEHPHRIPIVPSRTLEKDLAKPFTNRFAPLLLSTPSDYSSRDSDVSPFVGDGTAAKPYQVDWLPDEPAHPYNWRKSFKWLLTVHLSINCLCPVFTSSAYVGGIEDLIVQFPGTSERLAISGLSLYLIGQAFGPLLWAPASELMGRRLAFLISFPLFVLFNLAGAVAKNIQTVLVVRFFAGVFGAGQLANIGGQMADIWPLHERLVPGGLATLSPLLGPVLGPLISGFVGENAGFRAIFWVQFGFSLFALMMWIPLVPETYSPILLRRKATLLQREAVARGTGEVFISKYDTEKRAVEDVIKVGLGRPFELLFKEVIVWTLSLYLSLIYGILYLLFTAYPYIFHGLRHWSLGLSGLALLGLGLGMIIGFAMNKIGLKYCNAARAKLPPDVPPPPEVRLPTMAIGAVLVPIGLFIFAWTSTPNVHWIVPVLASIPFGAGYLMIFTGILLYLIDSYSLYAASALAANTVMRCAFGAAFPLFAQDMFVKLGANWAGTLLAFLSLACMPMPFLFYKYGPILRRRSRYAPSININDPLTISPQAAQAGANQNDMAPMVAIEAFSRIHP